jgi:hypothetical protein
VTERYLFLVQVRDLMSRLVFVCALLIVCLSKSQVRTITTGSKIVMSLRAGSLQLKYYRGFLELPGET